MPSPSRKDPRKDRDYPLLRELKARSDVRELMRRHGAHAVGIAEKRVGGKGSGRLALVFYVASKRPEAELDGREAVPSAIEFRTEKDQRLRKVATDVVESPPAHFELDPEDRHRPVPGGVSGGINGSTGTIGGWVWDSTDDTIVMLSNHHVLGHTAGSDVLQPGTADGGSLPADKIGDVKRGIVRSTVVTNTVDCAIASPDSSDVYSLEVHDIGPAVYAVEVPVLDMLVEKYGQTTEHTFGQIIDADYSTTVDGFPFDDCIRLEPVSPSTDWSAGGDSGSVVFAQEPISAGSTIKPAVGLHFAGGGIYGVACKIQNVFSALTLTTLCAGAFASFLDSEAESEADDERAASRAPALAGAALTTADVAVALGRVSVLQRATTFEPRVRLTAAALRPRRGLARDVQARLATTKQGRVLTGAVDTHRGELLTLLAKDGDVRRSALAALRPVTGHKVTTGEVLATVLDEEQAARFARLADAVAEKASPDLAAVVDELRGMLAKADGRTLGEVFGIRS